MGMFDWSEISEKSVTKSKPIIMRILIFIAARKTGNFVFKEMRYIL